jgi:hypothetical protein
MRTRLLQILLLGCLCMGTDPADARSPEPPEVTLSCVQPNVAVEGRDVFVACGRGGTLLVARGLDGTPVGTLQPVGTLDALALGRHRGPRVAASGGSLVLTAIGKRPGATSPELWAWRSSDRGRSWSGPVQVTDATGAAQEGLHGLAASGRFAATAWLDIRHGTMRIYASRSSDGGANWGPNTEVYASPGGAVCTCCHPSVLVDQSGTLSVMFRNDIGGSRDMYLLTGSGPAERLGDATWPLSACPMDGGGLARSGGGAMVSAWRRGQQVFTAVPGQREQLVGDGMDPAVAVSGTRPVVAWTAPGGLSLATPAGPARVLDRAGSFASVAAFADGRVVLAWQRGEQSVVRVVLPESQSSARASKASTSSGPVTMAN